MSTVSAAAVVAILLAGTAWLQRSEQRTVELDPAGPYRIRSTAGPIEVAQGDRPIVGYRASWLLADPSVTTAPDGSGVVARCDSRLPCRVAARLEVPGPVELTVESVDQPVLVERFDGDLGVVLGGDAALFVGPMAGRLEVVSEHGDIEATGLAAERVDIRSESGRVTLRFAERPTRLTIRSRAGPVTIELPDGDYAVSVEGGSAATVNVRQAETADSHIQIQASGPVRIDPSR